MKILRATWVLLATLFMYWGILLTGCGLDDLAGFFQSPARLGYSLVVVLFGLLVGAQSYHSLEGLQDGKGVQGTRVARQHVIGLVLVGMLLVALFLLPYTSRRNMGVFQGVPFLTWLGVLLCALGYLMVYLSGRALGRQYSAEVELQQDHQLITTGPYRLVRHPRYLGVLCLALGISLLFQSGLGLALCLPILGLVLSRIYDEEAMLQTAFGERWCQYSRHSWRLIPYVY